ncbi:MAG TPA: hypothetical protein VJU16_05260, partial [Planctomycetota bacterium]|nr:hypothetical protein [Planctomycetota bacterium]
MTLKSGRGKSDNYISMRAERDLRGQGELLYRMEHFDKLLDGLKIDGLAHARPHAEVFAVTPNRPDVAAGGTEFWIRFEEELVPTRPVLLFDIRESDETNRISITAQNGEIIYRITDASIGSTGRYLDKGWSEIRAPFVPADDTWYHIAAYWKGTRYGQMVLMIDGFVPAGAKWRYIDSDGRRAQSTELTSMLGPITADSEPVGPISLRDTVFTQRPLNWPLDRPWTVPIRIGEEVIEYEPTRNLGRRGSRKAELFYGRSAPEHPLGAKATLFGYTSPLRNTAVTFDYPSGSIRMDFGPIHATRGAVAHRFGKCRLNTLVGEQRSKSGHKVLGQGVQRVNFQILSDANIPTDSSEWPDSGFIRIENEAIHYRKIVRETKKNGFFDQCERGRAGTEDVSHMEGVPIELWSVAVTEPDPKLSNPTIVQFNEEWFGPVQLVQVPPGGPVDFYWIGCVLKGQALPFGRGQSLMTSMADHEVGERLVPVFAARERDPSVLRTNVQKYDPVTVIESSNHREQHMICNSVSLEELGVGRYVSQGADVPPPPRQVSDRGVQLAAFFAPTTRDFPVDGVHNRVLKWPSGELIGERYLALNNPVVRWGPAPATLDEVKTVASPTSKSDMAAVVDATIPELAVNGASAFKLSTDRPSGLVLVGEELVGFAVYWYPDKLAHCTRGWLGSKKEVHDRGDAVFPLDFLPVAALDRESLSHAARTIPISQVLAGRGYTRGYVFVNDEVIGFEEPGLRGTELDCLARFDGTGLFRGMFGTATSVHPKHAMVFGIPFRYWDGYKPRQFDNRMPYFQAAHTTRNARWRAVRFVAEVDSRDRNLVPNVYLRIDGLGDFPIPAVDDHSAVGHFTATRPNPLQDYVSSRLENGQVEARFFLEYK